MAVLTQAELDRVENLLDHLGYDLDPSILIGGWATQMRVGGDVSRDIDLIIMDLGLEDKLRELLPNYSQNTIHSGGLKGRGESEDGVHVDAYIPYQSALGERLRLKVERLVDHTDEALIRGWRLLNIHAHTATKFAAILDRPNTEKGEKDAREIDRRLVKGANAVETIAVLIEATGGDPSSIPGFVKEVSASVADLAGVNKKRRRELFATARIWVDEAEHQLRGLIK